VSYIRLDGVSYRYPTQHAGSALRGISCRFERGELVGITGPADAGKTTLCRVIAGYVPHFFGGELEGSVSVAGANPLDVPLSELATRVGYVFENPFDQLTGASQTVFEEVAFALENMGLERGEIRRRVEDSLAATGIGGLRDRHPGRLSGGQSQRVAIAAVLAIRPDVLVLDEPTSQLDPHGAAEVLEVIAGMRDVGATVIVVTQDLQRFAVHLDRLLVLADGAVRAEGPARACLTTAPGDLVRLPAVVTLGAEARRRGLAAADAPLPLTVAEAADLLAPLAGSPPPAGAPASASGATVAAAPSGGLVVAEALHFRYPGGTEALRGLSLTLDRGCVCIVGENGAGKTSLIKHFNGLLRPTSGRVLVDGQDTRDLRVAQLARHVSLAFQNPDDQLFRRTVEDEVRFGPVNLGFPEERVAALTATAIERLGLNGVRGVRPHELGLPWRKRVAVASSLALDAPVVVLDEPTGGQDAPGIRALAALVDALVAEGRLVVIVTHDLDFVYAHAARVTALLAGAVLLDGPPEVVLRQGGELARTHVEPPALLAVADRLGVTPAGRDPGALLDALAGPASGRERSRA
jgi:energy-coupling factor transport system ATP-binding protein